MKEILDTRNPDKTYTQEEFNRIVKEVLKTPWLSIKGRELKELLDICDTKKQKDLIFILLHKFCFYETIKIQKALQTIYNHILTNFKLSPENTVVTAVSTDSMDLDSSQQFIYALRNVINADWKKRLVTNIYDLKKILEKDDMIQNIIVIDDFTGTGEKIKDIIIDLRKEFNKKNYFFCTIASMKQAKDILNSINIPYFSYQWLEKGISDSFIGEQLTEAIAMMSELEKKLNNLNTIYNFGYKKSETLYSYEYNTPNNTFPIFWFRSSNETRTPIFTNRLTKSKIPTIKEKIYEEYPNSKDKEILDTIAKNPTNFFEFREKFKLSPENIVEFISKYKDMGIIKFNNDILSLTDEGKKWLLKNRHSIYNRKLSMIDKAIVNFSRESDDYSLSPSKLSILKEEKGN